MAFNVNFYEYDKYPRSRWDRGEFYAIRRVFLNWSDRFQLMKDLSGNTATYDSGLDGVEYPYDEGARNAYVRRVDFEPHGAMNLNAPTRLAQYQYATATIYHATLGPTWYNNTTWIRETLTPSREMHRVDFEHLRWKSDKGPVFYGDAPQKLQGLYEYRAYLHRVAFLPTWILASPGVVNANNFTTATLKVWIPGTGEVPLTFLPEHLRFDGVAISHKYTLGQLPFYDIVFQCTYHSAGWNKWWHPGKTKEDPNNPPARITDEDKWDEMILPNDDVYKNYPLAIVPVLSVSQV